MKNLLKKTITYSLLLISLIATSGCRKDDDNKLRGFWATNIEYTQFYDHSWCHFIDQVYEFVNDNTVRCYGDLYDTWGDVDVDVDVKYDTTIKLNGKTWYVCNNRGTYSYTLKDNKVYIPMKGEILTLSGNTLIQDGSSEYFKKQ